MQFIRYIMLVLRNKGVVRVDGDNGDTKVKGVNCRLRKGAGTIHNSTEP